MTSDEYGAYFFNLISRSPGQPADDYEQVLGASGIPAGLAPYTIPDASMPHHALTQQIGSDGRIAGRMFLPTAAPDPKGFFSHPFSPLRDGPTPGSLVWEWRDLGGPPVVTPGEPASGGGDTGGGGTDPALESRLAAIEANLSTLNANALQYGAKLGLRLAEGQVLSVDGGGGTVSNKPVTFQTRDEIGGEWERLEILKP